ncbi:MAG: KilA-N domain-containing protein [Saprospiraceae bacterium]|nr:KilA-N domain-containing protein [Saprospiraceae bacterium]
MKNKAQNILIREQEIPVMMVGDEQYLCITELAKMDEDGRDDLVRYFMRNRDNFEMLGEWERKHNPEFNGVEFDTLLKEKAGKNSFTMTPSKFATLCNAKGFVIINGRGGGVFAHRHIAIAFAYWMEPKFALYVIEEFDKFKTSQNWDLRRELSKVNYYLQTDAIQKHILPKFNLPLKSQGVVYASEADLLNKVVFDMTASEWRDQMPEKKGNLRDEASDIQLTILSNLESHNAELIKQGLPQDERFDILEKIYLEQLTVLMAKQQKEMFKRLKSKNS